MILEIEAYTKKLLETHRIKIADLAGVEPEVLNFRVRESSNEVNVVVEMPYPDMNGHMYLAGLSGWIFIAPQPLFGVVISGNAWVRHEQKGRGLNTFLNRLREEVAYEAGAVLIMAEVNQANTAEIKTLQTNGWSLIHTYSTGGWKENYGIWVKKPQLVLSIGE